MIFTRKNPPPGFYVYAYIRSRDSLTAKAGTPYYIGKGSNNRAWDKKHHALVPKNANQIVIISHSLTDLWALALERRLIRWYGRKDLCTGILHNLTDGGDGSGRSESTKQKLRLANTGKKLTPEHIDKIRKSNTGKSHSALTKQKLRDINLGKVRGPSTESTRHKISLALKGITRQKMPCPYCQKELSKQMLVRWHFDKCKHRRTD
jgi:hypothetical protein